MKLSCQEGILPGRTFAEKVANAERFGFDAIELSGGPLDDDAARQERLTALRSSPIRASSICGGIPARSIDVDPAQRRASLETLHRMFSYAAELGATGPIHVPIFSRDNHMPDLRPWKSRWELCFELCVEMTDTLAADAEAHGVVLLLEPLNRYEANFLNRLEQAKAVIDRVRHKGGVRIMADFFHMHIEEANTGTALTAAGPLVGAVHLADSTRKEPGSGQMDFAPGLAALASSGFSGYMALECGLSGDPEVVLPRSVRFLREAITEASK